jgi:diaminopimelate decarboxylase
VNLGIEMSVFDYRSDQMYCEDVALNSIAERIGTPAYVYSRARILENYRAFERGLAGVPHLVCYSVKANSNLKVLRLLREAGGGFDVVSGGELMRALKAGAKPETIVFSGVGKTAAEIDAGLAAGILMFNAESAGEMELIESRAAALRKIAGFSVRINPDVEAETHPYISTGRTVHKFGVPKQEARALYRRAAASKHLRMRGIACHIGSQILDAEPFLLALDEVLGVAGSLACDGAKLEFLDLGGGYGIRYDDERPLDTARLSQDIAKKLEGTNFKLILEPGRALVGDAGILLTRVLYVKRNGEKTFVIVDAGMNDLIRPALYGSYHGILPAERRAGENFVADVVGPLCETGDFLARDREMPEPRPGDLLAVLTVGAYGFVLSSNYNSRPRPAEVLVDGSNFEVIRPRERVEDMMAGEA